MSEKIKTIDPEKVVKEYMKNYKKNKFIKYNWFYDINHGLIVIQMELDEPVFKEDFIVSNFKCIKEIDENICNSILYFYPDAKKAKCCVCGTIYDINKSCFSCKRAEHGDDGFIHCHYQYDKSCPEMKIKEIKTK